MTFHSSVLLPESFTLLSFLAELAPSATDSTVLSRGSSNYSPRNSSKKNKAPERFTSSAGFVDLYVNK